MNRDLDGIKRGNGELPDVDRQNQNGFFVENNEFYFEGPKIPSETKHASAINIGKDDVKDIKPLGEKVTPKKPNLDFINQWKQKPEIEIPTFDNIKPRIQNIQNSQKELKKSKHKRSWFFSFFRRNKLASTKLVDKDQVVIDKKEEVKKSVENQIHKPQFIQKPKVLKQSNSFFKSREKEQVSKKPKIFHRPGFSGVKIIKSGFKTAALSFMIFLITMGIGIGTLYSQTQHFGLIEESYNSQKNIFLLLNEVKDSQDLFSSFLGYDREKKYMIIFQNPAESRPTGGFMGNFGILGLKNGKLSEFWMKDIYSVRDGRPNAKDVYTKPSPAYSLISETMSFHESNWYADFETAAKNIQNTYENKYGGWKTDGVISIDPVLVVDLLKLTGPINMPEYDVNFNSDNFWEEMHQKVELDNEFRDGNFKVNPKQILHDFFPIFLNKVFNLSKDKKIEAGNILLNDMTTKHILFQFNDPKLEDFVKKYNFAGKLQTSGYDDYLDVIKTSFHNKSSFKIDQKIKLDSTVSKNTITNKLTITHTNNSDTKWPEGPHYGYIMAYVPDGSKLVSAYNRGEKVKAHMFKDEGKTVMAITNFYTYPGETNSVVFNYVQDVNISGSYNFVFQKQPGITSEDFEYNLKTDGLDITDGQNQISSFNLKEKLDGDWSKDFGVK